MRYQIKARCAALGITQRVLREEVIKRTGEKVLPGDWSAFTTGSYTSPKCERILAAADKVLTEMESR